MEDDKSQNFSNLLLDRPFFSTAKTKISVQNDTLTMGFDGKEVKLNIYNTIKYLFDLSCVYNIDVINVLNQKYFDLNHGDEVNITFCNTLNAESLWILEEDHVTDQNLQESVRV